jgi:hypothetical protein
MVFNFVVFLVEMEVHDFKFYGFLGRNGSP